MADYRPDLTKAEVKFPNYIANLVFPPLWTAKKAGRLYYSDVQSAGSVQTDRTMGSAPTATTLSGSSTTFDLATDEIILRKQVDDSEVENLGGKLPAEQKAARIVKRAVMDRIEALAAAQLLAGTGVTGDDVENDLIGTVGAAVDTVKDYITGGEVAFVCSSTIFRRLCKYAEIVDRMKFTGVVLGSVPDVRGFSKQQLAGILGVDQILVGPDAQWYTASATYQERAAVCVLPDPNVDPLEELQTGRFVEMALGDESYANLMRVESYYDDNLIADIVQARAWAEHCWFNKEGVIIIKGLDVLNASSTTTSTTTA